MTAIIVVSRNASVPWMFSPESEVEPSSVPTRWVLQAPSTMQSNAYDMAKENGTSDCCCYKDSMQSDARLLPGCWEPCLEPAPTEHQTCMCTASLVPVELASFELIRRRVLGDSASHRLQSVDFHLACPQSFDFQPTPAQGDSFQSVDFQLSLASPTASPRALTAAWWHSKCLW